jgi:hypothetical protein
MILWRIAQAVRYFLPKQISVVRIVGWTIYRFFVNCSKKPACWSAVAKSLNARHDC